MIMFCLYIRYLPGQIDTYLPKIYTFRSFYRQPCSILCGYCILHIRYLKRKVMRDDRIFGPGHFGRIMTYVHTVLPWAGRQVGR